MLTMGQNNGEWLEGKGEVGEQSRRYIEGVKVGVRVKRRGIMVYCTVGHGTIA